MTTSRLIPSDWMWKDGNIKVQIDDIVKTNRGWEKIHPNGQSELIHALATIGNVTATLDTVTNNADGIFNIAKSLTLTIEWSEAVTVVTTSGTPRLGVYTQAGIIIWIPYVSGSTTDTLTFTGVVTGIKAGDLVIVESIDLNDGTIKDADGVQAEMHFPGDYVQPTIVITDVASVTNQADATYDDADPLSFTVVYNEAMDVDETSGTPSVQIYTEMGTEFACAYASGTGTTSLVFTGTPTGIADGSLVVVEDVSLNGGSIKNAAEEDAVSTFLTSYSQPTITMTTP